MRLTGSKEQAEDICQEAFLKFYGALGRFDHGRAVAPLLIKIATNIWRNRLRTPAVAPEELSEIDPAPQIDEQVLQQLERQAILNAIATLRPEYREVLSLRYDQGLSYREIAEVTGSNRAAVLLRQQGGAGRGNRLDRQGGVRSADPN